MQIVNIHHIGGMSVAIQRGVVYCGRPSVLGNPYSHVKNLPGVKYVPTREEAVECYRQYLKERIKQDDVSILKALKALKPASVLGCWCAPKPCHCEVIIECWQEIFASTLSS